MLMPLFWQRPAPALPLLTAIPHPRALCVAWQERGSRRRHEIGTLHRLPDSGEGEVRARFTPNPNFDPQTADLGDILPGLRAETEDAFDYFAPRLPDPERRDYGDYLVDWSLDPAHAFDHFDLLGWTEARLPKDDISLVDLYDDLDHAQILIWPIEGLRHLSHRDEAYAALRPGVAIAAVDEPGNPADPQAIRLEVEGLPTGYINRLRTGVFRRWREAGRIRGLIVDRPNGQRDRPGGFFRVDLGPVG